MTAAAERPVIYPALRAVEHATSLDGIRPRRLFGVLWPLWQVDIEADLYEPQAYEVLDRFLVRGIGQAGLSSVPELSAYFGIDTGLVTRVLGFLTLIQHVEAAGSGYRLTALGLRGLADQVRYVPKKSRQYLLFDRATMRPLPRSHYSGDIKLLDRPAAPGPRAVSLSPLFTLAEFQPAAVELLATRPDRAEYNVPVGLANLRHTGVREVWLPAYLVETANTGTPYLAYSKVPGERDTFLEAMCGGRSVVAALARAEPDRDPHELWTRWLAARGQPASALRQLPNTTWRVTLPTECFGEDATFGLHLLGSFAVHQQHFIQLWCPDPTLRRAAVLRRVANMSSRLRDLAAVREQLARVARQLEVNPPNIKDLSQETDRTGQNLRAWLAALPERA